MGRMEWGSRELPAADENMAGSRQQRGGRQGSMQAHPAAAAQSVGAHVGAVLERVQPQLKDVVALRVAGGGRGKRFQVESERGGPDQLHAVGVSSGFGVPSHCLTCSVKSSQIAVILSPKPPMHAKRTHRHPPGRSRPPRGTPPRAARSRTSRRRTAPWPGSGGGSSLRDGQRRTGPSRGAGACGKKRRESGRSADRPRQRHAFQP